MRFIDEARLSVRAGHGGAGSVSFRREKFIPRGGPDGGDGGKGGDVIFTVTRGHRTLAHFRHKVRFEAEHGLNGQGVQKTGRGGDDLVLEVPPGTLIKDAETGEVLADLTEPGQSFPAVFGGRGGKGNKHFATATHRTPRFAQPGEAGEEKNLVLELKLLADVGLIGLPNAGKSSLIAAISAAKPAIADYPFTTLTPNLGVVESPYGEPFVVADIPGLIEGAHQGQGLGDRFLRHVERTRLLVHVIDAAAISPDDPLAPYSVVRNELLAYNPLLCEKPEIVVLNKSDIPEAGDGYRAFVKAFDRDVIFLSAMGRVGTHDFMLLLARKVAALDKREKEAALKEEDQY